MRSSRSGSALPASSSSSRSALLSRCDQRPEDRVKRVTFPHADPPRRVLHRRVLEDPARYRPLKVLPAGVPIEDVDAAVVRGHCGSVGQLRVNTIDARMQTGGVVALLLSIALFVRCTFTCGFCRSRVTKVQSLAWSSAVCPACGARNLLPVPRLPSHPGPGPPNWPDCRRHEAGPSWPSEMQSACR